MAVRDSSTLRSIGFLGPVGTFTEQALLSQADLAELVLVPFTTIIDVLDATCAGAVDIGFVPIENSIEGTVNASQDALAFTHDLLIQREIVLDIELCLLGLPGAALSHIAKVVAFPFAVSQCRASLARLLPSFVTEAANSNADAALLVAERSDSTAAALSTPLAAKLYGLDRLSDDIADHDGNQTRFVVVSRRGVPTPTGHDKTSIVVYQRADEPGSLLSILHEFAARRINLSKLESRPTKAGLGDYCFVLDLDGHVADEVVADALRELHAKQGLVKFLGSYPAAGEHGDDLRAEAGSAWRDATSWVDALRDQIGQSPLA